MHAGTTMESHACSVFVDVVRVKEEPDWEQNTEAEAEAPYLPFTEYEEKPIKEEPLEKNVEEPLEVYAEQEVKQEANQEVNQVKLEPEQYQQSSTSPEMPVPVKEEPSSSDVDYSTDACRADQLVQHQIRVTTDTRVFLMQPGAVYILNAKPEPTHAYSRHRNPFPEDKPYTCDICDRKFKYLRHMENHKVNVHGEKRRDHADKPFYCVICNQKFSQLLKFTAHLQIHTNNPYSCQTCQERFPHQNELIAHQSTHSEMRHACGICKLRFVYKFELIKHKRECRKGVGGANKTNYHLLTDFTATSHRRINILRR